MTIVAYQVLAQLYLSELLQIVVRQLGCHPGVAGACLQISPRAQRLVMGLRPTAVRSSVCTLKVARIEPGVERSRSSIALVLVPEKEPQDLGLVVADILGELCDDLLELQQLQSLVAVQLLLR